MTNHTPGSTAAAAARDRLRADLRAAFKRRDETAVRMLRTLLAAIDNAEAVDPSLAPPAVNGIAPDVPRRLLTEAEVRAIFRAEAEACRAALRTYDDHGQHEAAAQSRAELAVIAPYESGAAAL